MTWYNLHSSRVYIDIFLKKYYWCLGYIVQPCMFGRSLNFCHEYVSKLWDAPNSKDYKKIIFMFKFQF